MSTSIHISGRLETSTARGWRYGRREVIATLPNTVLDKFFSAAESQQAFVTAAMSNGIGALKSAMLSQPVVRSAIVSVGSDPGLARAVLDRIRELLSIEVDPTKLHPFRRGRGDLPARSGRGEPQLPAGGSGRCRAMRPAQSLLGLRRLWTTHPTRRVSRHRHAGRIGGGPPAPQPGVTSGSPEDSRYVGWVEAGRKRQVAQHLSSSSNVSPYRCTKPTGTPGPKHRDWHRLGIWEGESRAALPSTHIGEGPVRAQLSVDAMLRSYYCRCAHQ